MKENEENNSFQSYFLGPNSENKEWLLNSWNDILSHWTKWRSNLYSTDGRVIPIETSNSSGYIKKQQVMSENLKKLLELLQSETPTYTPRYTGHMTSELLLPGILAHVATLIHNPNNASIEVARVGKILETQAINMLLEMIGMSSELGRGHFTSGGTVANLEAIWRARYRLDHWLSQGLYIKQNFNVYINKGIFELSHCGWDTYADNFKKLNIDESLIRKWSFVIQGPWEYAHRLKAQLNLMFKGPVILVPQSKHYSWQKGASIFGLGEDAFWPIELDSNGKLSVEDLRLNISKARLDDRPILMVVSIAGTTELGELDPINEVQDYLDELKKNDIHIWHHVDAAYGGFYSCLSFKDSSILGKHGRLALQSLKRVESVTLDPHKLGYIPYSCGAILTKDSTSYSVSSFDAPYLELNQHAKYPTWSTTLEGSRAATGAAATWINGKVLGYNEIGLGQILEYGLRAAKELRKLLESFPEIRVYTPIETNIVCFCVVGEHNSLKKINEATESLYGLFRESPDVACSKTTLATKNYRKVLSRLFDSWSIDQDDDKLVLIRMVLMNPYLLEKNQHVSYLDNLIHHMKEFLEKL